MGNCCSYEEDDHTGAPYPRKPSRRRYTFRGEAVPRMHRTEKDVMHRRIDALSLERDLKEYNDTEQGVSANEDDLDAIVNAMARLETKEERDPEEENEHAVELSQMPLPALENLAATARWNYRAGTDIINCPPVPRSPYRIICTDGNPYDLMRLLNQKYPVDGKKWARIPMSDRPRLMYHFIRDKEESVDYDPGRVAFVDFAMHEMDDLTDGTCRFLTQVFSHMRQYEKGIFVMPFRTIGDADKFFLSDGRDQNALTATKSIYGQQRYKLAWALLTRYADLIVDGSTMDKLAKPWRKSPFERAIYDQATYVHESEGKDNAGLDWDAHLGLLMLMERVLARSPGNEELRRSYDAYFRDYQRRINEAHLRDGRVMLNAVRPIDEAMLYYQQALQINRR